MHTHTRPPTRPPTNEHAHTLTPRTHTYTHTPISSHLPCQIRAQISAESVRDADPVPPPRSSASRVTYVGYLRPYQDATAAVL